MSDTTSVYQAYQGNTYLFGGNAPYVEEMYENYLANPGSVPDNWREYFDALQHVPAVDGSNAKDVPHLPVINAFAERAKQGGTKVVVATGADSELGRKRTAVQQLIAAYRNVGQRWADLDPLKRTERPAIPELEPSFYGFSDADQETVFNTSNTFFGKESMPLRELIMGMDARERLPQIELAVGHTVTALYEIVPVGAKGWLEPMKDLPASYALDDVFPSVCT